MINKNESGNFDFAINVGDITQNGNRINEWLDYFKNAEMIFDTREQMFSIGNNDLCPADVHELGRGADPDKMNPINATYFFTFEHPNTVPTSLAGVYVPCTYDFIIGDTYFLSINSEITTSARTELYGDIDGVNVYDSLKSWCEKSLEIANKDTKIQWRVAFCHEAPFTIITQSQIETALEEYTNDGKLKTGRNGSHLNTVGGYFFSKFLQENNFKLCMCGHKHTYSNSRLIHDDVENTMTPYVYEPEGTEAKWYKALNEKEKLCVNMSECTNKDFGWVKYAMTQACGFKLVSNKELPAQKIPWLLGYYPVTDATNPSSPTADAAQKFPNYIIWHIGEGNETESSTQADSRKRIMGKSWKIQKKSSGSGTWPAWKYLTPAGIDDLERVGGNGRYTEDQGSWAQSTDNIIVEHQL
jgi:hypothetical protein